MGQADLTQFGPIQLGLLLALVAALTALPVALVVSLALIRLFRWRVARTMRAAAGVPQDPATLPGDGGTGTLAIEGIEPTWTREAALPPLLGVARRRSRELAAIHAEAACIYPPVFALLWLSPLFRTDSTLLTSAALFGLWVALFGTPVVFAGMMVFTKQPGFLALSAGALVAVLLSLDLALRAGVVMAAYLSIAIPIMVVLMLMILRREPRIVVLMILAVVGVLLLSIPIWGQGSRFDTDQVLSTFGKPATGDFVGLWFIMAGVPTVVVVMLHARRLRAVGPLVFAATLLLLYGIGVGILYGGLFFSNAVNAQFVREDLAHLPFFDAFVRYAIDLGELPLPEMLAALRDLVRDPGSVYRYDPDQVTFWVKLQKIGIELVGTVLGALAAWAVVTWLAGAYRRRRASDQMVTLDVMMLIFVVYLFAFLAIGLGLGPENQLYGLLWGAIGLASFAGYKLWTRWRLRSWRQKRPAANPRTLLLLRVFGFDRRTQRLLEDVGERWRYLGPIRLISGPDLAYAALQPHEFFDFLNGRLSRAFVKNRKDLEGRLTEGTLVPDPDGRFRVEEFFCHDDTWRMTVSRLAPDSDAILMDLRGFSPANHGCIFEIKQLLASVPLSRVVFLADASTDVPFLETTLRHTWQTMPADSPNAGPGWHRAHILKASSRHRRTLKTLLTLLCQDFPEGAGAASRPQAVSGAASA
jgi:hypothetical protein